MALEFAVLKGVEKDPFSGLNSLGFDQFSDLPHASLNHFVLVDFTIYSDIDHNIHDLMTMVRWQPHFRWFPLHKSLLMLPKVGCGCELFECLFLKNYHGHFFNIKWCSNFVISYCNAWQECHLTRGRLPVGYLPFNTSIGSLDLVFNSF